METNDRFEFYLDNSGKWRWRRYSSNGRIVGSSSQGYANKQGSLKILRGMVIKAINFFLF